MEQSTEDVLTPGQVARLFGVNAKTVGRWARDGKIPQELWFYTPGRHIRFYPAIRQWKVSRESANS